jgi:hypothetical protein
VMLGVIAEFMAAVKHSACHLWMRAKPPTDS